MTETRKILYFDMDNVLVDFQSGLDQVPEEEKAQFADDGTGKPHYDDIPGLFSKMKPMPGAIDAVKALAEKYDCYVLTTAPWNNPTALQDKLDWIKQYFPQEFHKRVIFTHHKNLCLQPGAYLIDDRTAHGASQFGDLHIQFGSDKFPDWKSVVEYLKQQEMKERNLDAYLVEIGRANLLTIDEERALLKAVQEKGEDCEEMKQLEKSFARFVVSLSRQYRNKGLTIWELIEAGTEALRKAALTYDFDSDLKFITHAVSYMRPAMIQAIEEKE